MKNRNMGFSLIELIVSIAIILIIISAAAVFLVSGSKSYSSIYSNASLQVDSQMAMNQLENYIIDCNGGICFDSGTLYVINTVSDGTVTEHMFSYAGTDNEINYAKFSLAAPGGTKTEIESGLMSDHVAGIEITFAAGSDGKVNSADMVMRFERLGRTYTGSETVALRNRPMTADTESALIELICG